AEGTATKRWRRRGARQRVGRDQLSRPPARKDQSARQASGTIYNDTGRNYNGLPTVSGDCGSSERWRYHLSRSRLQARPRKPAPKPASTTQERVTIARLGARAAAWSSRVSSWR